MIAGLQIGCCWILCEATTEGQATRISSSYLTRALQSKVTANLLLCPSNITSVHMNEWCVCKAPHIPHYRNIALSLFYSVLLISTLLPIHNYLNTFLLLLFILCTVEHSSIWRIISFHISYLSQLKPFHTEIFLPGLSFNISAINKRHLTVFV